MIKLLVANFIIYFSPSMYVDIVQCTQYIYCACIYYTFGVTEVSTF